MASDASAVMFPERTTRSPLVLVGAIATAGMLVGGLVAFKKARAADGRAAAAQGSWAARR